MSVINSNNLRRKIKWRILNRGSVTKVTKKVKLYNFELAEAEAEFLPRRFKFKN